MIHHIWRQYQPRDAGEEFRNAWARALWPKEGRTDVQVQDSDLPRLFNENGNAIPFVKDVFDFGIRDLPQDAMMMFSASDIGFASDSMEKIELALDVEDSGDAVRHTTEIEVREPITCSEVSLMPVHGGKGVWFFRAGWWRRHRDSFPDMILPRAAWDLVMELLMTATAKQKKPELTGICWHVFHPWYYHEPSMFGNKHNLELCRRFLQERGASHLEQVCFASFFGLDWSKPFDPSKAPWTE